MIRTDGGNHPHRNFTSPHAYGVAANAVKRSNRKYQCTNQEIIAGRLAISALSQLIFFAHAPFRSFPLSTDGHGVPCGSAPPRLKVSESSVFSFQSALERKGFLSNSHEIQRTNSERVIISFSKIFPCSAVLVQ